MNRLIALALLTALAVAPAVAGNGGGRGQAGDCPLVETASSDDSGAARPDADAAADPGGANSMPARGQAATGTPRPRARWHSLLPGMIK